MFHPDFSPCGSDDLEDVDGSRFSKKAARKIRQD
jgi:hypothetical protein